MTIARALAGRPGLLILDDCTSALDYLTEANLLSEIRRLYPDMAIMLITNRIASAARAEQIAVLNGNGEMEAIGSDSELREKSRFYRCLCALQDEEKAYL